MKEVVCVVKFYYWFDGMLMHYFSAGLMRCLVSLPRVTVCPLLYHKSLERRRKNQSDCNVSNYVIFSSQTLFEGSLRKGLTGEFYTASVSSQTV